MIPLRTRHSVLGFTLMPMAGFAALGVAEGWALCVEIGVQRAGVVSSAMNTFGNLGSALSPVVVGVCLQRWNSWNAPLLNVAGFYLLAALYWLAIDLQ